MSKNKQMTTNAGQAAQARTAKGPEPERLKINGDWKAAVRIAMQKPKPATGWPR